MIRRNPLPDEAIKATARDGISVATWPRGCLCSKVKRGPWPAAAAISVSAGAENGKFGASRGGHLNELLIVTRKEKSEEHSLSLFIIAMLPA